MNESLIALAGLVSTVVGGVVMYLLNSINKRIDEVGGEIIHLEKTHDERIAVLEANHDKIQEIKLSKEDYYRDQVVMRNSLTRIEEDLKTLPERILNTLKLLGKV
jgi:hypothetical protein